MAIIINYLNDNKEWIFSGIGILFLTTLGTLLHKLFSKTKKEATSIKQANKISSIDTQTPPPVEFASKYIHLQHDIDIIQRSIKHDLSDGKKQVFLRFYSKYKDFISSEDLNMLQEKSSIPFPNYSELLCILLGLLESLYAQENILKD